MDPIVLAKTLAAASSNNVALAQTGTAGVGLTLNGSAVTNAIATLDTQRRLLVTSSGNDSAVTFTVQGTRQGGIPIVDSFAGSNAVTAQSNLDFLTVQSIVPSANTAANVAVGTTNTGSTPYQLPNFHITPFLLQIGVVVSGTVNYSVEYTYDDFYTVAPATSPNPVTVNPTAFSLTALAAKTANTDGSFTQPVRGWRLTVNSGSGTATATGIQAGIRN